MSYKIQSPTDLNDSAGSHSTKVPVLATSSDDQVCSVDVQSNHHHVGLGSSWTEILIYRVYPSSYSVIIENYTATMTMFGYLQQ